MMETVLFVSVAIVSLIAAGWALLIVSDRLVAQRARLALYLRRQGMHALPERVLGPSYGHTFAGLWRGRPVRLQHQERYGAVPVISVGTPVPTGQLRLSSRAGNGRSSLLTGDPAFDALFRLSGDARIVSGFTSELRAQLIRTCRVGMPRIVDGSLWLDAPCDDETLANVQPMLDPLVELAELFVKTVHQPLHKLWIDWMTDAEPGVRRTCLDLVDLHRGESPLPEFVAVLLSDKDQGVRLRSATLLERWDIVVDIACAPSSPRLCLEAVRTLLRQGSPEQRLVVAASLSASGETFSKAALALCESTGRLAEPIVESWLDVERASLVRGAVRWATRHGSISLLPRLRTIEGRCAKFSPLALETHEAIAAIRGRGSAAVGSLSLWGSTGEEGALSVSAASLSSQDGGLAVCEPE